MNTIKRMVLAAALALSITAPMMAAEEVRYIVILKQRSGAAPDVGSLGGRVEWRQEEQLVVSIPAGAEAKLKADPHVLYLERVGGEAVAEGPLLGTPAEPEAGVSSTATRLRPRVLGNTPWDSGTYSYDGAGNIIGIGSDTYAYDEVQRLKQSTTIGSIETYTYDGFGNMKSRTTNAGTQTIDVNLNTNRLSGDGYSYDGAGNVLTGALYAFTYDALGQPLSKSYDGGNLEYYVYTPADERIGVQRGSWWSWSVRDEGGKVLRQYRSSSTNLAAPALWVEDFVWRDGLLLGSQRPVEMGGRRHYHLDHLGTPRLITSEDGHAMSLHDYYPFGDEKTPVVQEGPGGGGFDREEPMKFTGHERDFAGGFGAEDSHYVDYMHARYFAATTGRFLSVDPVIDLRAAIHYPQMWNRYAYVHNNPINLNDPRGLLAAQAIYSADAFDETFVSFTSSDPSEGGGSGPGQQPTNIPAPTQPNGQLAPPPVPPPPGESGQPNEWVYRPNKNPAPGQRPGRWGPRDRVPSRTGAQPNGSWDDKHGHWDVDIPTPSGGKGDRLRLLPDGTRLGPDHKPLPNQTISVVRLPSPTTWTVQVPFTVMGWYMKQVATFWYGCGCPP
ncbi:MAG: RHS repeat-associated core domain-containing protein [Acidobacteriota bacterium]